MKVYGPDGHSDLSKARNLATRLRPLPRNMPAKKLREAVRANALLVAPWEVRATSEIFTEELGLSSHVLPLPIFVLHDVVILSDDQRWCPDNAISTLV